MNFADIILLAVTLAGLILGYRKGIVNQVGDMAAIVLGVLVCRMMPDKASQLGQFVAARWIDDPSCGWITASAGYILLFLIVYLGVRLFAMLLRKVTHAAMLGPVDRLCGSLFMTAKLLLALSIVMNLWLFISPGTSITDDCHRQMKPVQEMVISFAPGLLGAFTDNQELSELFHATQSGDVK